MFSELSELERLYLVGNHLEVLEPDVFSPLSGLEVLAADSNRISNIVPGTFEGLGICGCSPWAGIRSRN